MYTRMWASTSEDWSSCSTDNQTVYLLREHPDEAPSPVLSDLEPLKLDRVLRDLKRAVDKELMNSENLNEWKNLVAQLQEDEGKFRLVLPSLCMVLLLDTLYAFDAGKM